MAVRRLKIKKNPPPIGPEVTWTQFEEDGTERVRTGLFWSEAPRLSGIASYWVVPDDGEQTAVCVIRGFHSRRRSWGGGRIIEPGEIYSETSDLTPTGSLTANVQRMRGSA